MVAVRILVADVVVVAVVPGEPAACSGEQRRVQDLPVVGGGVLLGGEVGADAELLQHDRLAEAPRELARERGRQELSQPGRPASDRSAGRRSRRAVRERAASTRCRCRRLSTPHAPSPSEIGCVAPAARTAWTTSRAHAATSSLVPGAAVQRHLVRDEPRDHGGMRSEATGDLRREPRLLRDQPDVAIEVASVAPRRVPVLAGHVADDERRDRVHPELDVRVEEVGEPLEHLLVEPLRLGHEVGPVAERSRDGEPVLGEHGELFADDLTVVARPHPRPARARPEVGAEPRKRRDGGVAGLPV